MSIPLIIHMIVLVFAIWSSSSDKHPDKELLNVEIDLKSECILLERLADCSSQKNVAYGMCIKAVSVSNNNPHSFPFTKNHFCLIKMRIATVITILVTLILCTL